MRHLCHPRASDGGHPMTQDALFGRPTVREPRTVHPAQHLDSRAIRATWCRTCKAPILHGPNDVLAAFDTDVDPLPLSAVGELTALLQGRRTVALERYGASLHLRRRGRHEITSRPAGTRRIDVLATHQCDAEPLPTIATQFPARPANAVDPDAPAPF
ncbi:hypothetical protein [Tessaracoccus palaemonis]|uniref:CENP-V/GFA domain-containing protein n=1 Tax=Tessaracoccus palaemonis TaxID=2829499 RepID=A0ABX8SH68_9ACTN|nr:hypothetical protein [Tessaracoccus palaemonis]QXT62742.1 hypothetical protein KDB89_13565 [Tessaracoccus palaemonis]